VLREDAVQALQQASNDINKAGELLKGELVRGVEDLHYVIRKTARINLVLAFFSQP
jgi:hypothetical protein